MKDKEKEIANLNAQMESILEDLNNPCLDNQTTVLLNAMGKIREKLKKLQK